ncbi:unnamed protein product [Phaedon cochleariae]|uniref:Double jelly roll-like domain-containing protein n=1 Tax=Phaedon cochleariae TaxID=80249 RepID=A0A9N9SH97_PHACE|nr:unnamed protein product [Phaedon cochleariae]
MAVNFQDLILDISDSYIYIEGKFTPDDATKSCYLSNNTLAFLFDEIRYEMGGEQDCMIRKPGITTTMKSMISYGDSNAEFLETVGWGIDSENQPILDKSSHIFSGKLPLKYLMGFAEDYNEGILNVKQELILIIARSFKNCYIGEVDASVEINKIEWKIGHIMPSDKQRLKLLNRLNKSSTAKVKIAYRMWDLYELPSIRETSSDIWAVETTNSLERPRYIIIGFQNPGNTDNRSKDTTQFNHGGVNNIRLYLHSEVYPYERWNLDFGKKLDAVAYYAYDNFQRSYHGKDMSEPMMSSEEFRKNPLFIIDCSHQPDTLKSSTVDIKLEFETRQSKFPSNTKNYNCKYAAEIQSAHFGGSKPQVSMHTVVLYYRSPTSENCKPISLCTFCENLRHDPAAICAHLVPILKEALELVPDLMNQDMEKGLQMELVDASKERLIVCWRDRYAKTVLGEQFYHTTFTATDDSKIAVFVSPTVCNVIRRYEAGSICLQMDATFKVVPRAGGALQLFIIHISVHETVSIAVVVIAVVQGRSRQYLTGEAFKVMAT